MDINSYIKDLCVRAKTARATLARATTIKKDCALKKIAELLKNGVDTILTENKKDLLLADENGVPKTMLDRLTLNESRIFAVADSLLELVSLPDPVGGGERTVRPNGLVISKVAVPIGTIAIIYEARPNVTVDAAALCIKSGNAVVLRGGKEAINTNRALVNLIREGLRSEQIDPDVVCLVDDTSREGTNILMSMRGYIDLLIPRGGKSLIRAVCDNARVPIIETGAGNCHIYIDEFADIEKAVKVALNSKLSRPSVCNAIETVLVHEAVAAEFLPKFRLGCAPFNLEIRGCLKTCNLVADAIPATEEDYDTEFNDYIVAVKVVGSIGEAIDHINKFSTGHSEAIMTENYSNARLFTTEIDCAAVYVNASTRFTDGGEFGLGAEVGISTQKLHARGPMGLKELTTTKFIVEGTGQIR